MAYAMHPPLPEHFAISISNSNSSSQRPGKDFVCPDCSSTFTPMTRWKGTTMVCNACGIRWKRAQTKANKARNHKRPSQNEIKLAQLFGHPEDEEMAEKKEIAALSSEPASPLHSDVMTTSASQSDEDAVVNIDDDDDLFAAGMLMRFMKTAAARNTGMFLHYSTDGTPLMTTTTCA